MHHRCVALLLLSALGAQPAFAAHAGPLPPRLEQLLALAHAPDAGHVMIEAHRGSLGPGRPENSVPALLHAIEIGVDIVEIDVRRTRDGGLVLMHDSTIDRTTDRSGAVADLSLGEVSRAHLLDEAGQPMALSPPTLAEALEVMRDRQLFRLDLKCGDPCRSDVYDLVEAKGLMAQAVIQEVDVARFAAAGLAGDRVIVVGDKIEAYADPEAVPRPVDYVQVKDFDASAPPLDAMARFAPYLRMVAFPYSDRRSGGHGDEASAQDPASGWGWLVDAGADILLTDEAEALIDYLEQRELRAALP